MTHEAIEQREGLTRPIIGIENRTAQEVFDIMCDRIVRRLAAEQTRASTPAVDREADLFQAIHDAMADEINGEPSGDIIEKGCEAAGYCDPESAADAFKAAAVQAILSLHPSTEAADTTAALVAERDALAKRVGELEAALRDVLNPLGYLKRKAEAKGNRLGGMAYAIASDPETLRSIALAALNTDPSHD